MKKFILAFAVLLITAFSAQANPYYWQGSTEYERECGPVTKHERHIKWINRHASCRAEHPGASVVFRISPYVSVKLGDDGWHGAYCGCPEHKKVIIHKEYGCRNSRW